MGEIGICSANCKVISKCCVVRPYFMCNHTQCYNVTNKFKCCIICGCNIVRSYFIFNDNEIILNHSILNDDYYLCNNC